MAKLYTPNTWVDEVLAGAERYDIKENGGAAFKDDMQIVLSTAVSQAGTPVDADKMNNIEDGIDAIDTRLDDLETEIDGDMIDYSALSTIVGWSSFTTKELKYKLTGKRLDFEFRIEGTSDSVSTSFTLPYQKGQGSIGAVYILGMDTNAETAAWMRSTVGSNVVAFGKGTGFSVDNWTASGTKRIRGQGWYYIA